jgi:hypothetical protein
VNGIHTRDLISQTIIYIIEVTTPVVTIRRNVGSGAKPLIKLFFLFSNYEMTTLSFDKV